MKKGHYKLLQEQTITGEELLLMRCFIVRETKKNKYSVQGIFGKINDPEEYAKVAFYVDLIDCYGYSVNQVEIDVVLPNSEKGVDMIVYENEDEKKPYIVIECKKENISDIDFNRAVKEIIETAHFLKAPFAVCVSGDRRRVVAIGQVIDKKQKDVIISDFPKNYYQNNRGGKI